MDIRVAISRGLAYGIVGVLLVASFVGFNLLNIPLVLGIGLNAVLGLFWAFAAHRLRDFIQTPLEEKWITGWYDSDKLVNSIAQKLVPVMEREAAFKIIADELKAAIKIKNIEILSPAAEYDRKDITHVKQGLLMPIYSSEGLEGALLIGPKISEDPYVEKDLTIFRTIKIHALAILDRIRPYEKIKKEFEANQKKLYDTERLLARSERIASLANLIREYNHEIKTPLTIIRTEVELLPKDPKLDGFRKAVVEAIERADDIVESTLRLSEPRQRKTVELNLNEVIEAALKIFPPAGVHLVKDFGRLPPLKGDEEDLKLALVNLIKNAVEAMPDGGELKISTSTVTEDDRPRVRLTVSDTGAGIPEENREKIFEPFFSTHVTKGRGLGLSIVFRIVREHGGRIEVASKVGAGTTFSLTF